MPSTAAALHSALDAGQSGREVLDAVPPALRRAEAEGDRVAIDDLRAVVDRAWAADLHPQDRPELERLRALSSAEPAWKVIAAVEAALAQRQLEGISEPRSAPYLRLIYTHRIVASCESWGGVAFERGSLDGDPDLDWL
jgi:hypothetical protein